MNSAIPLVVVLLVTMVQIILAHPAKSDDFEYTTDDCPPGIWVCRKKRAQIPKPIAESNDCPPGIWTCQKKRSLEAAKQMDLDTRRRQQILKKMIMREKERESAKMLNAAKLQGSQSQLKRSNDCPPGIWVC
ncbi:uncharacterized protein LOC116291359 [Actinia tenebrosa]|uniref:Uncharacterized protein LOC116291359 n=1 Tax=Actinia tenebrosa TaxID=6105 RepID=A0A6P8HP16_ACTTE|nr:uncharacterized protein LOC116291359 [Actinia tenebrosa]